MDKVNQIEQQVLEEVAKNMADDINEQVLTAITMEYIYPYKYDMYGSNEIAAWVDECVGWQGVDWDYRYGTYYFKRQQDLTMFIIKWANK